MSIIGNSIRAIKYSNVPFAYKEVEYIQSYGSEYIDTGIPMNSIGSGKLRFIVINATTGYFRIFGGEEARDEQGFYITPYGGDELPGNFQFVYNRVFEENTQFASSLDTMFDAEFAFSGGTGTYTLNGAQKTNSLTGTVTSLSGFLFTFRRADAPHANRISAKMYEFRLWDFNDDLIQDLVPCYRKSDNVVGMWDTVSKTFFINSGTGAFTAGPAVN